jgi:hypothetical protein
MKKDLEPVCEELEINPKVVLSGIKTEAFGADKADTRLKALFKLSDILDLEDKHKVSVTQVAVGAFKGFSEEHLEAVKPKEIENE